ncbi:cytidylate kinase family protein [Arthrobacter sp. 92]|uniref:cytidylate kinase family protein n=1 Tax=Arthrobacter sp. 92 TaxID=3418175 RepID=UPI003CFC72FE
MGLCPSRAEVPLRINVAFAGLTAAGKTTHARILAESLGYRYVSATELLLKILNIDHNPDRVWFERSDEVAAARQGDWADQELETQLVRLAKTESGIVFDTWALAWIAEEPMVRIWIEFDLDSRARKCYVSQCDPVLSIEQCKTLADAKDESTRQSFLRRHGYDLRQDRHKYDRVITNSHLIPKATHMAAAEGIRVFSPTLLKAVLGAGRQKGHPIDPVRENREK